MPFEELNSRKKNWQGWEHRIHRKKKRNGSQASLIRETQIKFSHIQKLIMYQQPKYKS